MRNNRVPPLPPVRGARAVGAAAPPAWPARHVASSARLRQRTCRVGRPARCPAAGGARTRAWAVPRSAGPAAPSAGRRGARGRSRPGSCRRGGIGARRDGSPAHTDTWLGAAVASLGGWRGGPAAAAPVLRAARGLPGVSRRAAALCRAATPGQALLRCPRGGGRAIVQCSVTSLAARTDARFLSLLERGQRRQCWPGLCSCWRQRPAPSRPLLL